MTDDEVEPLIKYERIQNDGLNILNSDTIRCIAVHEKIIVLGSYCGMLYVIDHQGNIINGLEIKAHKTSVNAVAIDTRGETVASCSDDAQIFVLELFSKNSQLSFCHGKIVHTLAIVSMENTGFESIFNNAFDNAKIIVGDRNALILYEQSGLLQRDFKPTVLCDSEDLIMNVSSRSRFVAWANNVGIRVFDLITKQSLGLLKWDIRNDVKMDKYKCHLSWTDDTSLVIGWMDTVRICFIQKTEKQATEFRIDITTVFRTDFIICGVNEFNKMTNDLIFLGIPIEQNDDIKSLDGDKRPQLFIISNYQTTDSMNTYVDYLNIRGFEMYKSDDYQFAALINSYNFSDNQFFILAPKDLLIASPYSFVDRLQWYVEHSYFEEALDLIDKNSEQLDDRTSQRFNNQSIGKLYFDHLFTCGDYKRAADVCIKYYKINKSLWQDAIRKLAAVDCLHLIYLQIPDSLDYHCYQMVLLQMLRNNPEAFVYLVKKWNPNIYNVQQVINVVLENLKEIQNDDRTTLVLEGLAYLYMFSKNYIFAVSLFLKLQNEIVFDLIQEHKLYNKIINVIPDLMKLNHIRTLRMLMVDKFNEIDPKAVVEKLENDEVNLCRYLDMYNHDDPKGIYHLKLIQLYGKYNREKLLPFLKRSNQYAIQDALDICQNGEYVEEMAYLLDRIGNAKEALDVIFDRMGDIEKAVIFCNEHKDNELWTRLIEKSLQKPDKITYLLETISNVCTHSDLLIRCLPAFLEIPGLNKSIIKLFQDYNSKMRLENEFKKILVTQCFTLHKRITDLQFRGIIVTKLSLCSSCKKPIVTNENTDLNREIRVFNCQHFFHEECLIKIERHVQGTCVICCK